MKSFSILGFAFIILLAGCTQEYKIERMYYHANKKYSQIIQKPSQADPAKIDEVIADFNKIIKTKPDWNGVINARYAIAHLYFIKKDFSKARERFNKIISDYPSQKGMHLQITPFIGASYEYEGKWDKALAIYEKMIKDYPLSPVALQLSYHIADYYQKHKKYDESERVLRDVISRYENVINNYPYENKVIIASEEIIIKTYEKLNDIEGLINILKKIADRDKNTNRGAESLYRLAKIYESKKRVKEAIDFYKQFIKNYPDHKLVDSAKTKIHSLELTFSK